MSSGGSRISRRGGGVVDLRRRHFLAKMYAKMKELGLVGGGGGGRAPDTPPRSANDEYSKCSNLKTVNKKKLLLYNYRV